MKTLHSLFAAHHGVVRAADHPLKVRRALERSTLRDETLRILPGIYVPTAVGDDPAVRLLAVARWAPNWVVTGQAALRLLVDPSLDAPHIDVMGSCRRATPSWLRFHRVASLPSDVRSAGDLFVTSPTLSAVWLAAYDQGAGIDLLLRQRATSLGALHEALDELRGMTGTPTRARIVARSRSNPWSFQERELHDFLDRHGIRGWKANVEIRINGERFCPDVWFPRARLALDYDSHQYHHTFEAFHSDRLRHLKFTAGNIQHLMVTSWMLQDHTAELLTTIRRLTAQP